MQLFTCLLYVRKMEKLACPLRDRVGGRVRGRVGGRVGGSVGDRLGCLARW